MDRPSRACDPPTPRPAGWRAWLEELATPALPLQPLRELTARILLVLGAGGLLLITLTWGLAPLAHPPSLATGYALSATALGLSLWVRRSQRPWAVGLAVTVCLLGALAWVAGLGTVQTTHLLMLALPVIYIVFIFGPWAGLSAALLTAGVIYGLAHLQAQGLYGQPKLLSPYNQAWAYLAFILLCSTLALVLRQRLVRSSTEQARQRLEHEQIQALQKVHHRLAMAVRIGRFGVWEYDLLHGEFIIDDRERDIFGAAPGLQRPRMKDWLHVVHADDLDRVRQCLQRALAGQGGYDCRYRIVRRDRSVRWIHSVGEIERDEDGRIVRLIGLDRDITEEEERLQRLRLATKVAKLGVWEYDFATERFSFDAYERQLFGLPEDVEVTRPLLRACLHPEDLPGALASMQKVIEGGAEYESQFRIQRDGQVRWLRGLAHVDRDSRGRPVRMLGVNWDVTEDVQARQALQDVNQRLLIALSTINASVWEYDAQARQLRWDERGAALYGIDVNRDRQAWESVLSPECAEATRQRIYALLKDPGCSEFDLSYTIEHPQLGRRHIRSVARNERDDDGRLVRTIGLDLDITAQVETATHAEMLAQRLQLAITAAGIGVWSNRLSDGAVEWNEQQYRIYGLPPQSPISRQAWLERVHPDDRERMAREVAHAHEHTTGASSEFRIVRPDGQVRHVRVVARGTRDAAGHPTGTIGLTFDITPERQATEAIQRARAAAEEANRLKSEFLANVSHEIRTPMNAIIGMTELALGGALPARERDQIAKANAAARNLLVVLNDILDFSKIEAGKLDLDHTAFSLPALVGSALDMVRLQAQAKGLTLDVSIAPDVPEHCLGDPTRLGQVLTNLLSNAVKFTERGRVDLRIALASAAPADRPIVRFEVEDTGIGLTEEQQARLFEAFAQADASTTRRFGGTGLGLVISRRLLDLMGGRIGVRSKPGGGSLFWFQLPLERETPGSTDTGDRLASLPRLDGLRVLLAEDNPLNRELAVALLEQAGAQVQAVDNGAQAVCAVQQDRFDVVLMDVQMPVMDGFEATRRIRALPGPAARLPIVAMTAHAMSGDRERSLAAGMNEHLTKPIDSAALRHTLARLRHSLTDAAAGAAAAPSPPPTPAPSADAPLPLLDAALGVRLCGQREDLYHRALQQFVALYADCGRFQPDARPDAVQREAHSLKGAASSLGLLRLQHQAAQLEAQCKSAHPLPAADLAQLNDTLAASCQAVRAYLGRTPSPP
ncbi:PAS domain-containing protein [Caldimonas sp.]|uniref:PAS domain-containing protein n=1 Tax=Caldimonas sp. TaxID=2838790 RepID=UPI00307D0151